MKKELKDYLHLYLGCNCQTPFGVLRLSHFDFKGRYKAWFNDGYKENSKILLAKGLKGRSFALSEIKPILRPLSDITDEEWMDIETKSSVMPDAWGYNGIKDNFLSDHPDQRFGWPIINETLIELRRRSVDVDDLIKSGLAISKPTLQKC